MTTSCSNALAAAALVLGLGAAPLALAENAAAPKNASSLKPVALSVKAAQPRAEAPAAARKPKAAAEPADKSEREYWRHHGVG